MGERRYSDDSTVELLERSNFQSRFYGVYVALYDNKIRARCQFCECQLADSYVWHEMHKISLLEPTKSKSICCSILIRLLISVFFLLILSACLVWSFNRGEVGVTYTGEIEKRDAAENFTVFINQFALNGKMTETFRGPDGTNEESTYHNSHSIWYQDNDRQELVQKYDAFLMIYARKDYTFFANTTSDGTITSCSIDRDLNYVKYIETIGLTRLLRPHGEKVQVKKKKYVYVYQGEPGLVQLPYQQSEAFLVLAYADADTGALLGYDTYFTGTPTSNLFKREYWYSEMLPAEPRDTSPLNIPPMCSDLL
ncbi:hypothetical protein PRIPAC_89265 [Pristionchus pacificus]|uniref:Uncharacterized protein n=1 Tax=Pristionchus pacificus TaxID=54126 RepID=A0A2A6B8D6_PRIPA|nr:hypothetical protein PRIPAC_89265 [Pristionchus pacificus]|eukprot:PDM62127.1 hypothetical protein PRIPAC_51569 [Pristionchus pacificus]